MNDAVANRIVLLAIDAGIFYLHSRDWESVFEVLDPHAFFNPPPEFESSNRHYYKMLFSEKSN